MGKIHSDLDLFENWDSLLPDVYESRLMGSNAIVLDQLDLQWATGPHIGQPASLKDEDPGRPHRMLISMLNCIQMPLRKWFGESVL